MKCADQIDRVQTVISLDEANAVVRTCFAEKLMRLDLEGLIRCTEEFNFALLPYYEVLRKQYCDSIARNMVEMSDTAALKSQLTKILTIVKTTSCQDFSGLQCLTFDKGCSV